MTELAIVILIIGFVVLAQYKKAPLISTGSIGLLVYLAFDVEDFFIMVVLLGVALLLTIVMFFEMTKD